MTLPPSSEEKREAERSPIVALVCPSLGPVPSKRLLLYLLAYWGNRTARHKWRELRRADLHAAHPSTSRRRPRLVNGRRRRA